MGAGRGEKKHREQGWPQDPAHMAGKEKQGGPLWVERWGTPHTLLHFILPNTLYDGCTIILILPTRSQDWESLRSHIFYSMLDTVLSASHELFS